MKSDTYPRFREWIWDARGDLLGILLSGYGLSRLISGEFLGNSRSGLGVLDAIEAQIDPRGGYQTGVGFDRPQKSSQFGTAFAWKRGQFPKLSPLLLAPAVNGFWRLDDSRYTCQIPSKEVCKWRLLKQ